LINIPPKLKICYVANESSVENQIRYFVKELLAQEFVKKLLLIHLEKGMTKLENITKGIYLSGIMPNQPVEVIDSRWAASWRANSL
jgi:hypothetical protein